MEISPPGAQHTSSAPTGIAHSNPSGVKCTAKAARVAAPDEGRNVGARRC